MVKKIYIIDGITCGSCAMRIERVILAVSGVKEAHVTFSDKTLSVVSEQGVDEASLVTALRGIGKYTLMEKKSGTEKKNLRVSSPFIWAIIGSLLIALGFYLLQVLGMQDWQMPFYFLKYQWYFVLPLILGFGVQVGLFRAIHLLHKHGGGVAMAGSGSVSGGSMLACCMHNLVPLFPILGASGLATFFSTYQSEMFFVSIGFMLFGIGYMLRKYMLVKTACASQSETSHGKKK